MVGGLTDAAALPSSAAPAGAAIVSSPTAAGTAINDAKRVAALERLVALANGPAASFLGSGWVRILRTLSALDALMVRRTCAHARTCVGGHAWRACGMGTCTGICTGTCTCMCTCMRVCWRDMHGDMHGGYVKWGMHRDMHMHAHRGRV